MKKVIFKTLGCKVNQYETQAMREALLSAGYKESQDKYNADLCVVNTCTVTEKADKESRRTLRNFLRENPDADIIAAGCYAEADAAAVKAIDERIKIVANKDKAKCVITYFKGHTKAFVKIQDGCDNFCSYCKVPYVRGRSKSRSPDEILEEAGRLIGNGYKELVLTGICLGDFGKDLNDSIRLTPLIKRICGIEEDFRVRLSSIELPDVTDALIDEMANSAKLCHHLHIPLQSGDDTILALMNRRYKASGFIDRIRYIRSKIPDVAITTDVIVGFPGETERNFKNTLKSLKRIKPSRTHIFTYSPREGTKAFDMKDSIHPRVKAERFKQLKELADKFTEEFKIKYCGRKQRVLVEDTRDKNTGLLAGYTDTYIKVLIEGPDELKGKLVVSGNEKKMREF